MTDVQSVVADLKQTPQGKLVYNEKNWSTVLNETSSVPKLHVASFIVKETSRLVKRTTENRKDLDYKNYFSRERANQIEKSNNIRTVVKEHVRNEINNENNNSAIVLERILPTSSISIKNKQQLHSVNKEYDAALKSLSTMRLNQMKDQMSRFEDEYQSKIEIINQNQYMKHQRGHQEILQQQKTLENIDEISYFDNLKQRREQLAKQKSEQAHADLQKIREKQNKLEKDKNDLLEKKKSLGKLAEGVSKTLGSVVNDYKQYKASGNTISNEYSQLIGQMIQDYQACTSTVSAAINKDSADLDIALQFVTNKLKEMEQCSMKCNDTLHKLKAEREILIAKQKKEADDAAKAKATIAATAAITASASVPALNGSTQTPASSSSTSLTTTQPTSDLTFGSVPSIEEAVPILIPLKNAIESSLHLLSFKSAFEGYLKSQKLLLDTEKVHAPISSSKDKSLKTYKFDLYKVVNTQINAISDESPKHLMEKVMKLNNLLNEGDVVVPGKTVSVKGSPKALALVKDLIAKKLVLQGQSQVASSFKAAFPIAAVSVGLWSLFPDFGDLLIGHFYNKCPFLVPFYIPKTDNISTVEYCKLVGYDVDGETVEDEDKYLNKLSGTVRLYAAMMQMDMPPQLSTRSHPFSIEHGWIWFTRLMNLEPRPSVTATIIFDFLEVAGHALMKKFGKQFQKVLLTLCQELMPKILEVTPANSKAGAMRLKMFLEKCVKEGKIKPPDGVLTQRWWGSTGH